MLVSYVRDSFGPFATFVALSPKQIGVSICCPKDHFTKKMGIHIAEARASMYIPAEETIDYSPDVYSIRDQWVSEIEGLFINYVSRQRLLYEGLKKMQLRAQKYFKSQG